MTEPATSVLSLTRPHPRLLRYYVMRSVMVLPLLPVVLPYLFFRYKTMRYRFDEEGVSQRWGVLFRREISLTYSRLQDIHLASNLFERWLGLARVQLQTASGSSKAEMTIEGLLEYEEVRDFLYARMRGVSESHAAVHTSKEPAAQGDPLVAALDAVAEELAGVRRLLANGVPRGQQASGAEALAPAELAESEHAAEDLAAEDLSTGEMA